MVFLARARAVRVLVLAALAAVHQAAAALVAVGEGKF